MATPPAFEPRFSNITDTQSMGAKVIGNVTSQTMNTYFMSESSNQVHYRSLLKEAFSKRCASRPQYSLRAFARDVQLSPSFLSRIFNGKRELTTARAEVVAGLLGWEGEQKDLFVKLVMKNTSPSNPSQDLVVENSNPATEPKS